MLEFIRWKYHKTIIEYIVFGNKFSIEWPTIII